MTVRILIIPASVLALVFVLSGCRSDVAAPNNPSATADLARGLDADVPLETCQVLRQVGQSSFLQTYRYDNRGLLSRWEDASGNILLPQYDSRGALVRAKYHAPRSEFASTIVFVYDGANIVRENWYEEPSNRLSDIVVNTWNSKGQLILRQSLYQGSNATFQYDAVGNAYQVDESINDGLGILVTVITTYTFSAPVKSPDLTLRGLPYPPQYINRVFNPQHQTGAKADFVDYDGSLIPLYDFDPNKSILVAGQQHFPLYQQFFNTLTGTYWPAQTWSYQRCPGNNYPPDTAPSSSLAIRSQTRSTADLSLGGPMGDVRRHLRALNRKRAR